MRPSSSTSILLSKDLVNFWASWVHSGRAMREVKLLGTTTLSFPCSTRRTTDRSLAISPYCAKEVMFYTTNSSRPVLSLSPSSVRFTTFTIRSRSLGTIPVGRMVTTLVVARYSRAKWVSCLTRV
jgi:hypothetical protein